MDDVSGQRRAAQRPSLAARIRATGEVVAVSPSKDKLGIDVYLSGHRRFYPFELDFMVGSGRK